MKKIIFILLLSSIATIVKAQFGLIAYTVNFVDSTYSLYQFDSPSNFYGNRLEYMWVSKSKTKLYARNISLDSLNSSVNDGLITGGLVWLDNTGKIKRSPKDSLKLGYINLPFTSTTFLTQTAANGLYYPLLSNPSNYLTSITSGQITSALGYTPYNGTLNPLSFLTSVPAQSFSSLTGKPTTLGGYGIIDAYPLTGNPSGFLTSSYTPTINSGVTRPINSTTYTISTTKQANVSYTIKVSCTATIGSNSDGKVALQYSTNSGSTWIDVGEVENSNTVTLAVVLQSVTIQTGIISGNIPANALVRMNTTTVGTTTVTYVRGQETY